MEKSEGIVLKTINYGESHLIIRLFTREYGKISVMARGAKKPRSPLRAVSQVLVQGSFLIRQGSGLGTLYQGETEQSFKNIKADIMGMAYAAYIIELVDRLTEEREKNPYLYELILQVLNYMNEGVDPQVLAFIFEVKMLPAAGIEPTLDYCVHCGGGDAPFAFSLKQGGVLCKNCSETDLHKLPLTEKVHHLLRLFKHLDLSRLGQVSLKQETRSELQMLLNLFYEQYAGLSLKSKRFLEQLDKMNGIINERKK